MNLSRWSLRFPVTATMVILAIVALGGLAAVKLPHAFLPEVDFPGIEVTVPYPNALPAQVEEEITRPVEEALATMSGIRRVYSWSSANQGMVFVQFHWGSEIGPLRVEAREKLERIRDQLPVDVDLIQVNSFRSTDIPVLECRVSAERDLSRQYELLNRHVADPLRRVPGVAKVELYGIEQPEVYIDFRMADMRRHQLNADDILQKVNASNRSMSAGLLRTGDQAWPLRVVNQFDKLEDLRSFPINGQGLKLSDVATVALREPDLDYGRHLDQARAIGLDVIKESGANTVQVVDKCLEVLEDMKVNPMLRGIQVLTFTDQAQQIRNSLRGLLEAGILGAFLATGVLLFFLRRLSATVAVGFAIPISLLAACALLYFTGRTLNILSMMGLMLAVGLLVDNAVVVLESIYRLRQKGKGRLYSALAGAREVLPAVMTATMTSVIVFLPLVLGGRTEITTWLGEVGRTIIFALFCSLFLSLTAIPLLVGRFLKVSAAPQAGSVNWLSNVHQSILKWTLRHRPATLAIAFGVVATAVIPFSMIDKSAFSGNKIESVRVRYEFADNLNHEEVERYVTKVEEWIHAKKDSFHIKSTYSYFTHNFAVTRAYLIDAYADDEGAQKVRKLLRERAPVMPGAKINLGREDSGGRASRLRVRIFGDPGPRLDAITEEVSRRLARVEGLTDVDVDLGDTRHEVQVKVFGDRAAQYGLNSSEVASNVALFFRGRPLSRFRGPDGEVQIQAQLAQADRSSLEQLERFPLVGADGQSVPLAAIAEFKEAKSPTFIQRQQRRTMMMVSANTVAKKAGKVRKAVSRELNAMHFPTGYSWSYGSGFDDENETQQEMLINLLLALFLVYFVMAALFESLLHPFAIMFALPFAFVGIAWMSFLTGSPFNLMAQIGLLILVGIVVNNGIVLIYKVHQLREKGIPRAQALLEGSRDRLRPILMTTATTVLGLLPLALGSNHVGDVLYFPLARTVMGGLLASTALTLVLVPCLYTVLEDTTAFLGRIWKRGPRAA